MEGTQNASDLCWCIVIFSLIPEQCCKLFLFRSSHSLEVFILVSKPESAKGSKVQFNLSEGVFSADARLMW